MSYNHNGRGGLSAGMQGMRLTSSSSASYSSGAPSSDSNVVIRKVDEEWRHHKLPSRPEKSVPISICVGQTTMPVLCNWFQIKYPAQGLKLHSYNVTYTKTSYGEQMPCTKKEKTREAFWHIVDQHPNYFPDSVKRGLIFDDVHRVFILQPLKINGEVRGSVKMRSRDENGRENAPAPQQGRRGPPSRLPPEMGFLIQPTGIVTVDDFRSQNPETKAMATMILDLIMSQNHRNPTTAHYRLFVQDSHSFFKVPPTGVSSPDCVSIGKGQEVWMGLHTAVKTDSNEVYLNANSSSSIFYKREIPVVQFYAEILHGFTMPRDFNYRELMMSPQAVWELENVIKGTKVIFKSPSMAMEKAKKVHCITRMPASQLYFEVENRQKISVAEYFQHMGHPLQAPHLPCIEVKATMRGKSNAWLPLEFCRIGPDPMKYKGRVSDQQLAALIKAASRPAEAKRRDIMGLVKANGDHLSGSDPYMREYGVSVVREMITVEAKVLQKPNITMLHQKMVEVEMEDKSKKMVPRDVPTAVAPNPESVHDITHIDTNGDVRPSQLYEPSRFKFFPIFTYVASGGNPRMTARDVREAGCKMMQTLRAYGLLVRVDVTVVDGCNVLIPEEFDAYMAKMFRGFNDQFGNEESKDVRPLFIWVFNQRNRDSYESIKYMCDIKHGVVSQCILAKNLQNIMTGNPVTNNTSTNIMHKVMAKCGGIPYHIDKQQYNIWKRVTNKDEPTLFLAIDVSHPGMEERMKAESKKNGGDQGFGGGRGGRGGRGGGRGGRPAPPPPRAPLDRKKAFEEFSFADCPRSVLTVVGNVDIEAMRYDTSCRVVRLGMEVSVHIKELFRERIKAFMHATGRKPAHVIVYRDGVSGGEFQKVAHEEGGALEDALKELEITATVGILCAQKRHHTRFFAKDLQKVVGEHGNLPPGTLLEDPQVVSSTLFDFFLQSHHGQVGTARPTHYTVLKDTWAPSPAFWQTLANGHAYGYIRCPFAISLPAPLQYAHLAAKKAKGHYDAFRNIDRRLAPRDYFDNSRDDFYRESFEEASVRIHKNIQEIRGMTFV